jgi:predicted DNA-binding protein YlxM (UPF0122 family)
MKLHLTDKQSECEDFMAYWYRQTGRFPSVRAVAKNLNISPTAAFERIKQVKKKLPFLEKKINMTKETLIRKIEIHIETTEECIDNTGLPPYVINLLNQDNTLLKEVLEELKK